MKKITDLFDAAYTTKNARGWEKIFVAVDIHETIMEPTWSDQRSHQYYPYAKETLQMMSKMPDICLIQWSSSSRDNNLHYNMEFSKDEIEFDHINENPEVPSTSYADFSKKFYMNVILDDKAGFEPKDWIELYAYFKEKLKIQNG